MPLVGDVLDSRESLLLPLPKSKCFLTVFYLFILIYTDSVAFTLHQSRLFLCSIRLLYKSITDQKAENM